MISSGYLVFLLHHKFHQHNIEPGLCKTNHKINILNKYQKLIQKIRTQGR